MSPDLFLTILSLTVLVAFVIYIFYLLISSKFQRKTFSISRCPPGACITQYSTGVKTCPSDSTTSLVYDPTTSTCNSQYLCDNPLTPYAIQSDGSTNNNGVCEPGVQCKCSSKAYCPSYVLSVFTTNSGNPYMEFEGQELSFSQNASYVPTTGSVVQEPPLEISDTSSNFCMVSIDWLSLSNPGCRFSNEFNPTYDDIVTCMGLPLGCIGMTGSACLQGTLAFIGNSQQINQSNYNTTL